MADDESCANPAANNLGEVRIELHEFRGGKTVPFPPDWKPNQQVPEVVRIHEHSKRVMTHCVGYGGNTKEKATKLITNAIRGKKLATFVFRYRALAMLQAQGIVPHPAPQQVPSTQREKKRQRCKEEDIEVIDDGEADRATLKILKAEINKIEARLLKRQKTMVKSEVKSEDKAPVIANEVIELE